MTTPDKAIHLKDTPPGIRTLVYLEQTDSTQTAGRALIEAGADWPVLIIAGSQSAGRGRRGDPWASEPGGLYMTLALKTEAPVHELPALSVTVARTASLALARVFGLKTKVKPPNDVLAWHPGKKKYLKICGIIAESAATASQPDWIVVGIGVNLNNTLPRGLGTAVTVKQILGRAVQADTLAHEFFKLFRTEFCAWETGAIYRSKSLTRL
ncbi:MAG: biotin--[acetyl-CoA-carboxylase] ligase [Elusimicrobiaceae bacterium]|nr:biotin--[acetyl-CoA-carboxylase] ligase [Elusimicrobiaceae bacterium]